MAPLTAKCLTCAKNFANSDMAIQLNCLDGTNNITVQTKLKTCIPEVLICSENDELCTTCNYMLGICYKFRATCLQSQQNLTKALQRRVPTAEDDDQKGKPFSPPPPKTTNERSEVETARRPSVEKRRSLSAEKNKKLKKQDPVAVIEANEALSELEKEKLLLVELLKLNAHLSGFKASQFNCVVRVEPLPDLYVPKEQVEENTAGTGYLCQCNHCGLTFTSKVKLLSHIRRHFNYKPHKCSICERSYYEADDLKMHMMAHKVDERKKKVQDESSEPPVKRIKVEDDAVAMPDLIPIINIKTESIYEELNAAPVNKPPPKLVKKVSLQNVHPPVSIAATPAVEPGVVNGEAAKPKKPASNVVNMHTVDYLERYIACLRCRFCDILFKSELEMKQHAELHCTVCLCLCEYPGAHDALHTVTLNKNKKTNYMCLECGTYNPRGHFILHHKIVDIICEICSSSFTTEKLYQRHRIACPEYRCKYCGKSFATLNHGRTHEYHTHEKYNRGDLKCPRCEKQFPMAKLLKLHVCNKCENCDEYVDVKYTKRHVCVQPELPISFLEQSLTVTTPEDVEDSKANIPLLIPLEIAPDCFKCAVCSNTYETKDLLDAHECYDDAGVRVYHCQICTGYFSRLDFIEHMKLHID